MNLKALNMYCFWEEGYPPLASTLCKAKPYSSINPLCHFPLSSTHLGLGISQLTSLVVEVIHTFYPQIFKHKSYVRVQNTSPGLMTFGMPFLYFLDSEVPTGTSNAINQERYFPPRTVPISHNLFLTVYRLENFPKVSCLKSES